MFGCIYPQIRIYPYIKIYIPVSINVLHMLSNVIVFMHLCRLLVYFHLCIELRLLIHSTYSPGPILWHIYIFCICEHFVFVFVFSYRERLLHLGSVIHERQRHLFEVGAEEITVLLNKGTIQKKLNKEHIISFFLLPTNT